MISNVWTERFAQNWTDEMIDAIIEVRASPLELKHLPLTVGAEMLRAGLRRVFVSSAQIRQILRMLIDIALAHASAHFVSIDAYMRGLYEPDPWIQFDAPAICFTGLAGGGKSELLHALQKLLGGPVFVHVHGHTDIPLLPGWFLTLKDGANFKQMLEPCVGSIQRQINLDLQQTGKIKGVSIPSLLKLARRRAWRDGVCILGVDEFQFISLGREANARATSVLLNLFGLGPRLIYVANFSLVHRLKKRGQEDRDRLLQSPIILHPEVRSSPDWIRLLERFKEVAPEVFDFDVKSVEELIHRCTFGIKRSVIRLLVAAFRESYTSGSIGRVGEREILRAYGSAEYSGCRDDVEILRRQQIGGKALREDLWCPFSDVQNTENVSAAQQMVDDFNQRVAEDNLRSALLPREAAALKKIEKNRLEEKPPGTVVHMPKPKVTAEALLEGSKRFDKLRR